MYQPDLGLERVPTLGKSGLRKGVRLKGWRQVAVDREPSRGFLSTVPTPTTQSPRSGST